MREQAKNELKNAIQRFHRTSPQPYKTVPIQKRSMKKKRLCPRENFYQRHAAQHGRRPHVLNFYNMLAINQLAVRHPHHDEAFMKTYFYHKNLKRIEAAEHYLLLHLGDHRTNSPPVPQVIAAYKTDPDPRFHTLARLLEDIERRTAINRPETTRSTSLSGQALGLLDSLGDAAYICRISSNRLVVSKAMMEMFGYNSEDFVIECLKFRMPLFEGFSCHGYYELVVKHLEHVNLLLDYLDGRIPLATFSQLNRHNYQEVIESKNNIHYRCAMSLSMPVPLISLIKVESVLETREVLHYENPMLQSRQFRLYASQIREKEYSTLQYLLPLPDNVLPANKLRVADYAQRNVSDEEVFKSQHTHSP